MKEADPHSVLTLFVTTDKPKLKPSSQVSGSSSSSAWPLSLVNSHGDNNKTKYSCLERRQVPHGTHHVIKYNPHQHRTSSDLKTRAIFHQRQLRIMKLLPAIPPPDLPIVCRGNTPLALAMTCKETAARPVLSTNQPLGAARALGQPLPSGLSGLSSAQQEGSAHQDLAKGTLSRCCCLWLLTVRPPVPAQWSIRILRTQGRTELLVDASDTNTKINYNR